jgi:hypothetical protein
MQHACLLLRQQRSEFLPELQVAFEAEAVDDNTAHHVSTGGGALA